MTKISTPTRWLILFLAIGTFLRLFRYYVAMPVWGDEAFVGLNIISRGYADLLKPLDYAQVAPPGFLLAERFVYLSLGMGEYAMRLIPMLAGLAALFLFAYWARLLATPAVAAVAVGIMAIGNYPVRYAVELKPYGIDMFASLVLLILATHYFLSKRPAWLIATIIAIPFCLFISFPAIFIAGAIGIALLANLNRKNLPLTALYGVVSVGFFLLLMKLTVTGQFNANKHAMTAYWSQAFPPANPRQFILWFLQTHTGNMFAYPFGARNGGSTVSFAAFLIGIAIFFRNRGRWLPILILAPFALNFIAAVFRRYPYGDSARVLQYLAPAIVLLIAVGFVQILDYFFKDDHKRRLAQQWLLSLLVAYGIYIFLYYVFHPYQTRPDLDARNLIQTFWQQVPPNATIAVLEPESEVQVNYQWYLRRGQDDHKIIWDADHNTEWQKSPGPLLVVTTQLRPALMDQLTTELRRPPTHHISANLRLGPKQAAPDHFESFTF
jgi:hypothetical protein